METKRGSLVWQQAQMLLSAIGIAVVVVWLVSPAWTRLKNTAPAPPSPPAAEGAVRIEPDGAIVIADDSPLRHRLAHFRIAAERVHYPALSVSGSILATVRAGDEPLADRWQFSSGEMAGKYAEWLKSKTEIQFAQEQLEKTQELVTAQTEYLATNVERLKPAARTGSISEKEFRAAQAELIKAELQGKKDTFSAQSALRQAQQNRLALERDLAQGGIEADIFERAVDHRVVVAAYVPETQIAYVHEGQGCVLKFYAWRDRPFPVRISKLSPLLVRERRTLRVLFELTDPDGRLRPGMFADVGLGTDEREAIRIPAEALLHVGRKDFIVVASTSNRYHAVEVEVADEHEGAFEVISGITPTATIVTQGAILLRPAVVQALSRARRETTPEAIPANPPAVSQPAPTTTLPATPSEANEANREKP